MRCHWCTLAHDLIAYGPERLALSVDPLPGHAHSTSWYQLEKLLKQEGMAPARRVAALAAHLNAHYSGAAWVVRDTLHVVLPQQPHQRVRRGGGATGAGGVDVVQDGVSPS